MSSQQSLDGGAHLPWPGRPWKFNAAQNPNPVDIDKAVQPCVDNMPRPIRKLWSTCTASYNQLPDDLQHFHIKCYVIFSDYRPIHFLRVVATVYNHH